MPKAEAFMTWDALNQRRRWYTFFPEGSAEFLLVTRVLVLAFMGSVIVVRGSQLPLALTALSIMIWIDHVLVVWWAVQVGSDIKLLRAEAAPDERRARRRRVITGLIAAAPSVPAFLLLSPWAEVAIRFEATRTAVLGPLRPVLGVLFLVSLYFAYRAMKETFAVPASKSLPLLIPIVQGFGAQRFLRWLQEQLAAKGREFGRKVPEQAGISLWIADIFWWLMAVPWVAMILLADSSSRAVQIGLPLCGTLLAALFATAQLAAIEAVQKQFVSLIRR